MIQLENRCISLEIWEKRTLFCKGEFTTSDDLWCKFATVAATRVARQAIVLYGTSMVF